MKRDILMERLIAAYIAGARSQNDTLIGDKYHALKDKAELYAEEIISCYVQTLEDI